MSVDRAEIADSEFFEHSAREQGKFSQAFDFPDVSQHGAVSGEFIDKLLDTVFHAGVVSCGDNAVQV